MRVEQLMHAGDALPVVQLHTAMRDVIYEMSRKGLGMTSVVERTAGWPASSPTATCAGRWRRPRTSRT